MKKQIIAGMAAAMVCVGAVGGTFAYLTQVTNEVTNTFAVGENVGITLDEALVTELGEPAKMEDGNVVEVGNVEDADRVIENHYKLIPGHTYVKDPTVTVNADTADCYVFVRVENGIAGIEGDDTIESQIAESWSHLEIGGEQVYYWTEGSVSEGEKLEIFANFTVDDEETIDTLSDYENAEIRIVACAVQADGFDSAEEAAVALPAGFFGR